MHKNRIAVIAVCLASALPATALADGGLLAKAGLMGVGVEYVHPISDSFAIRGVVNGGSLDESAAEAGIDYDFDLKLRSGGVILDWHPFGGGLFASAGVFYNKNEINALASGNLTVGGNTQNQTLTGKITFDTAAPYVGLGWGHSPSGKGLSLAFELGVLYQGSAKVRLQSSNPAVTPADLAQEEAELEDSLKEFKYYPQVALGFGYRF